MRLINVIISLLLLATAIFGLYNIVVLFSNIKNPSTNDHTTLTPEDFADFECKNKVSQNLPCLGLIVTTRNEWLAQPPHNPLNLLDLPVNKIIITDTKTETCSERPKCKYIVRSIQEKNMMTKDDIQYNFLINTIGDFYEGRGWLAQSGETSHDFRNQTYWIALIGNFTKEPAPEIQIQGFQNFIKHAESIGKLKTNHTVYCSKDFIISNNNTYSTLKTGAQYIQCLSRLKI